MRRAYFCINRAARHIGSSVLRGEQLSTICNYVFQDLNFFSSVAYDDSQISDSFVYLTKSIVCTTSPNRLERLRSRRNILAADFLDSKVNPDLLEHIDVLVASSRMQYAYFQENFPNTRSILLTHHVDIRIPDQAVQNKQYKCGYFGEPANAAYYTEISQSVDIISTAGRNNYEWMSKLDLYNAHYAVRRDQAWDGFKPFTKGFIAAHLGVPIIVSNTDSEAMSYLGIDYPFRYDTIGLQAVLGALDDVRDAYGSERWLLALEIMREVRSQTGPSVLARELRNLLFET